MRPELVTAIVAAVGMFAAGLNVWVTLRLRVEVRDMRQDVLDRVAKEYKRQDVCEKEMSALHPVRGSRAC